MDTFSDLLSVRLNPSLFQTRRFVWVLSGVGRGTPRLRPDPEVQRPHSFVGSGNLDVQSVTYVYRDYPSTPHSNPSLREVGSVKGFFDSRQTTTMRFFMPSYSRSKDFPLDPSQNIVGDVLFQEQKSCVISQIFTLKYYIWDYKFTKSFYINTLTLFSLFLFTYFTIANHLDSVPMHPQTSWQKHHKGTVTIVSFFNIDHGLTI